MSSTKETILAVDGMTCSSCVRHVEAALRQIDGVGTVEVKLRDGQVNVRHDPIKAPLARMIEALEDAGYESRARDA
jgi:copper chaperone CopZ